MTETGCLRKTWWDCVKEYIKSLGLSQLCKSIHSLGINGEGISRGQPANPGSPEKKLSKWCLHASVFSLETLQLM